MQPESVGLRWLTPTKRQTLVTHIIAERVLGEVLPALAQQGIDVLPVKGFVTARQLYRDPSDRPITDVDIRVPPATLARVVEVMRRERWTPLRVSRAYGNVVFAIHDFAVDVETTVGPPGLCGLRVVDMLERSEVTQYAGLSYRRPELIDHAILLCVNAFKDKLTGAAPWAIGDLELVIRQPGFDVATLICRARSSGVTALLWIVSDWLAQERDDARWAEVRERIGPPPRPVYTWLFHRLLRRGNHSLAIRVLARAAPDSALQSARALATALAWGVGKQFDEWGVNRRGER